MSQPCKYNSFSPCEECDKCYGIKNHTHVYCTNCRHFRLDDEEIPYCPYEEKECDIRDCEDSRPFSERPMYEE
ncbi:MAG: hypothetical protein K0R54_6141 [Clostridiaceae bacterium]|jgi:hypothetical protein|nr:hypothetical protein [Clostridiaceae bacterium]MDF2950451.1 hypothetical protein [Anaerocolumna sp.]